MAEFQAISGKRGPHARLWLDIPKRPEEIAQPRTWNKLVKEAIRKTLLHHHEKNIPRHFKREARERYKHKPRSAKYKAWKRRKFGSIRDLVMTGRTERHFLSAGAAVITIGGAAEGGKKAIAGKMTYVFGFNEDLKAFYAAQKGRKTRDPNVAKLQGGLRAKIVNPNRVTIRDMREELQRMTPDEVEALQKVFSQDLMERIDTYKAGRKRTRR